MRALDRIFRRRAISQAVKKLVPWTPVSLFANNEQGAYFDPNNTATLFEDAAGTIPTALERPVGLMRDLSGRGNHATSSSTARPTLTRRVNLLSNTEDFSGWTLSSTSISPQSISGFGKSLQFDDNSVLRVGYGLAALTSGVSYKLTVYVEMNDGLAPVVGTSTSTGDFSLVSDASLHTAAATVERVGTSNVYKVSSSRVSGTTGNRACGIYKYTTQSTRTFRATGFDVRVDNFGVGLPTYQRVGDTAINAADYDTTGFPAWLRCEPAKATAMVTPSIDFTGTDKMTVWAGVRKLSDAATAVVVESSTNSGVTSGVFAMFYPYGSSIPQPAFRSGGSVKQDSYPVSGYTAPIANVLSGIGDIFGDRAILRVNGTQAAISTADQGTGNYGNYPLYLFARNQSSQFFNGLAGPIIVRGAQSSTAEIANAENWINAQQKVYQPPKLIFTALDSNGTSYPILDASTDSSGSTYTITATVLDSAGTSYNLI